jgi:type IV secretory pathway VirB4 component
MSPDREPFRRYRRPRRERTEPGATPLIRPGLRIPRHRATTAHMCALYPFHADEGLGPHGIYLGEDISAGGSSWHYDVFQLYTDGIITSPNIVVLGMVGAGKSSAVKTMLYRTIGMLGADGRPRWCAILDPKGEYGPLARALGLQRLALFPGGATRLNPLDAGPHVRSLGELRARRTQMSAALAASMLHRELTATEEAALGWAIDLVTEGETTGRQKPTLHDVVGLLASPTETMVARSAEDGPRELARSVVEVRHGLGKLLHGPLRGMFDGPSTVKLDWTGRGIVIDLSAVHQDPDALTVVMIAATGWLQALLAAPEGDNVPRRIQVLEEIWALLGSERVAKYYQSCQKLARAYGVANISVAHRISDLRAQSDDGTSAAKVSMGILADTQTRILFRQSSDQIPEAVSLLGLTAVEAEILPRLARGRALWRVGDHTAIVQHRIGSLEWDICDTDQRLTV